MLDNRWQYKVMCAAGIIEVEHTFNTGTKGEALLKAALWVMEQESNND